MSCKNRLEEEQKDLRAQLKFRQERFQMINSFWNEEYDSKEVILE